MSSTQVNFRISDTLKQKAKKKASKMEMTLTEIMKVFLEKFVTDNVLNIEVKREIDWEKVFDEGVRGHFMSKKGKKKAKEIERWLEAA